MKYGWKCQLGGAPMAWIAGEYIEAVKAKRGGITRQLLVIEAQKGGSPLHNFFEWNNDEVADEHRLEQAGKILRYLVVTIEQEDA